MKKYKITTAKKAVQKILVKVGDEIWVKAKVTQVDLQESPYQICIKHSGGSVWLRSEEQIRIPIPKPKTINFGEAGRALKCKSNGHIYITTGRLYEDGFYAYIPATGFAGLITIVNLDIWTDITDTYKPETDDFRRI